MFRTLRRLPSVAATLGDIGNVHSLEGRQDEAESAYREALSINERLPSPLGIANMRGALGMLMLKRDPQEGRKLVREALRIHTELGDPEAIATSHANLAWAEIHCRDFEAAVHHLTHARRIAEPLGIVDLLGKIDQRFAIIYDAMSKKPRSTW
jgi:tetratricopeptide (TPR) repeat protein